MGQTLKNTGETSIDNDKAALFAAGLLWSDRFWFLGFYLLLTAPVWIQELTNRFDPSNALFISIAERGLELLFLFCMSTRWAKRLRSSTLPLPPGIAIQFTFFGFLLWALVILPPTILSSIAGISSFDRLFIVYLIMVIPGIMISYKYFMYFFPMTFGRRSFLVNLKLAGDFITQDRYLPIRILVVPIGISTLLLSLCAAPYPDGRNLTFSLISGLFMPIEWVLSCYIALAYALNSLTEKAWREYDLDPYREGRCTTIMFGTPKILSALFKSKNGIRMLIIGLFVWIGNYTRLEVLSPPVTIKVLGAEVAGNMVKLDIEANDTNYNFRSFRPIHFRLAGEKYLEKGSGSSVLISSHPLKATAQLELEKSSDLRFYVPSSKSPLRISLTFEATRSGDALTALQDLYLWYRHAKISPVKFQ